MEPNVPSQEQLVQELHQLRSRVRELERLEHERRRVPEEPRTTDITESKHSRQDILAEKDFLDTVINSLPGLFYLFDETGRMRKWNRNLEILSGYSFEEIGRMNALQFVSQESTESSVRAIREVFEHGDSQVEATLVGKDGRETRCLFTGKRIRIGGSWLLAGMAIDISQRKKVEDALNRSEYLLRKSQAIGSIGSWEMDLIADRLSWSDQVYRIFGVRHRDFNVSYDAFFNAVHPDDREAVKAAYWGSIHEGRDTYEIEHRIIRGDSGEIRFVAEKCEHVRDGAGSVIRSIGMVQDITESKRTEASLLETKERMSQALRAANAGAWEWRLQTNEAIWSDENYLVLGLEPGSVKSCYESWIRVVHPEDRAEADRLVTEAVRNRSDLDISFRVVWPDGSVHWINDRGKLVLDGRGEPLGMFGIQIDITERQRAQDALQKKEEYYRSLLENALDMVTILGPDGIILFESASVERVVGYRPEELVGRDAFALIHPEDAGPTRELFERLVRTPGSVERAEFRFRHRNGSWRTLEAIGKNLLQLPAVGAIVVNEHDVTDRRDVEEQLRISLQQKETLLRETHHRLKNNLQVISSLLHLQSRTVNNPQALEALRESQQRVKAMAMIHERLYQTENVSCIVLKGYIEDLVHGIVQANAQDQPVALQFDIPAILLSAHAAVPCGLIINELVSNCLKHAFPKGQKGHILIRIRPSEDERLTLLVEDDGQGLPEEVDIDKGGALGLTLVRVLVKQLEGTIEIQRGAGTRFRIIFSDKS